MDSNAIPPRPDEDIAAWTTIIHPRHPWFHLDLRELWQYRDLVLLFVRRDFVAQYKQTILGPAWFFLQPLFTTVVFTVIFGRIAKIPTDGIPAFLFYLSGTVCWGYFAACLVETSDTFAKNANIFGKVYFPRLVVPISIVISNLGKFLIQFTLFVGFLLYFLVQGAAIMPTPWAGLLPLLLVQMALLGLGSGLLVSSLTTKYRDLSLAVTFGVQLWMYATPVVYPLSQVPDSYKAIYTFNPMVAIVEGFRTALLGAGSLSPQYLIQSWAVTLLVLVCGMVMFSRIEKTFMDTV